MFLIFATIIVILGTWFLFVWDKKKIRLSGPPVIPLLGNGHHFMGDSKHFFNKVSTLTSHYGRDGQPFLVYILSQRYILLSDPKYIEPILSSSEFNTKGVSYRFLKPWLGQGLLTSDGYRWKSHRKFLTPAFHFNILHNFLPVFCKNAHILVGKLEQKADGRASIDLFPIIALAALDNVTESIMGVCVNAQKDSESKYVKAIEEISKIVSMKMRNPLMWIDPIYWLLQHKARQDEVLNILHGQTMQVIHARRNELKKLGIIDVNQSSEFGIKNKYAFLDLLLLGKIDGMDIDDVAVREEVDTFMFEGHDTTTSGIVFSLYCISKYMDVQEKILSEQRDIFGDDVDRDPTYNELSQMKYLEMVIKEALRLYPSVPFIERLVTKDTEVHGIKVPRNTSIILNLYHMQRRADIYEDPLQFRPERFNEVKETKQAFNWLAFSAGPRNCIGQKFAMMELKVTLSAILRRFKIMPDDKEPTLTADLILRTHDGVFVRLLPRK